MGGRGGNSSFAKKSVFDPNAKEIEIKSTYTEDARQRWRGTYAGSILEAMDR